MSINDLNDFIHVVLMQYLVVKKSFSKDKGASSRDRLNGRQFGVAIFRDSDLELRDNLHSKNNLYQFQN